MSARGKTKVAFGPGSLNSLEKAPPTRSSWGTFARPLSVGAAEAKASDYLIEAFPSRSTGRRLLFGPGPAGL